MTTKTKIITAIIALTVSYAFGRFSAPEKVRIETKTVEVEKKVDTSKTDTDRNRRVDTTTTEEKKPDGTTTKTTHTVEETETTKKTDKSSTDDLAKSSDQEKEVTRGSAKVTISALAGVQISDMPAPLLYGVSISKPVLGPIAIGLWGLTNGTIGCSIGLSF